MSTRATRRMKDSDPGAVLYIAFELGHRKWSIRFSDGEGIRDVQMPARDLERLVVEIGRAKAKFCLPEDCQIRSCYEAGWDGFWLHRFLTGRGISNVVVDPASIEVNRRFRRAKTDRLDVTKLLALLLRHVRGEKVWNVVVVPSPEEEDARQLHREMDRLRGERQRHRNRIQSLLVTQGVVITVGRSLEEQFKRVSIWDGGSIPPELQGALGRELERLRLVEKQIRQLRGLRTARLQEPRSWSDEVAARLVELRAIGPTAGWTLATEFFGWRRFRNGKQVGSLAGLSPTPYSSGNREREQGIDKAGSARVRRLMVEIAWGWLRLQPESALSRWYRERFAAGGARMRRVGIVALARKLLVALWHYLEHGIVPEGAQMKPRHA